VESEKKPMLGSRRQNLKFTSATTKRYITFQRKFGEQFVQNVNIVIIYVENFCAYMSASPAVTHHRPYINDCPMSHYHGDGIIFSPHPDHHRHKIIVGRLSLFYWHRRGRGQTVKIVAIFDNLRDTHTNAFGQCIQTIVKGIKWKFCRVNQPQFDLFNIILSIYKMWF
jgi:hypothetical protein